MRPKNYVGYVKTLRLKNAMKQGRSASSLLRYVIDNDGSLKSDYINICKIIQEFEIVYQ